MSPIERRTSINQILTALLILMMSTTGFCAEPPEKMTHIVVQYSGTDFPANSFMERPKAFWRAANSFCRSEDEMDPIQIVHLATIMNEPDVWTVDLAGARGKHRLDLGPTFNCRLPIFAFGETMATGTLGQLEFGHELEFFKAHHAAEVKGPELKAFKALYYELNIDGATLRMIERADTQQPALIALVRGNKMIKAKYSVWEEIPFNAELFKKPTEVQIEEANQ
jgi:hypothetical protein